MVSLACTRTSNRGSCISLILLVQFLSFRKTLFEAHALLVLGIYSLLWLNRDWSILWKNYSLFIHSLVGWHFDWFQFGPTVNRAAISIFIPERWCRVFHFFIYCINILQWDRMGLISFSIFFLWSLDERNNLQTICLFHFLLSPCSTQNNCHVTRLSHILLSRTYDCYLARQRGLWRCT